MLNLEHLNIQKTVPQGCLVKVDGYDTIVYYLTYKYKPSLNKLNLVEIHLIQKLDILFKVISTVAAMHKQDVCHFNLSDKSIIFLNDFTPVLSKLDYA